MFYTDKLFSKVTCMEVEASETDGSTIQTEFDVPFADDIQVQKVFSRPANKQH